jgi:endonuclease VIII
VPEGDTIRRSARVLHDALAGRTLHRFASSVAPVAVEARLRRLEGQRVEAVDARGKYLLVRFSGGVVLLTHLGLHGSWHLYRASSPWPASRTRVVLDCGDRVAVCFAASRVALLDARAEACHPSLATLGPDVLAPDLDVRAAVAGLQREAGEEIGVALVDQRALAGVGNIYRCEALFACRVDPFARVSALDEPTLERLVRTAARTMRRSVVARERRATGRLTGPRYAVYRRGGRPCPACGGRIRMDRQGPYRRATWWCPGCQTLGRPSAP